MILARLLTGCFMQYSLVANYKSLWFIKTTNCNLAVLIQSNGGSLNAWTQTHMVKVWELTY